METEKNIPPLFREFAKNIPSHLGVEIPPPIFLDMDGEILEYEQGKSITTRFPFKERYRNPVGMMQGGMIVAALDNTFGPLSYLVAPPSVTTHLNTTFIRPVTHGVAYIQIKATLLDKTVNNLFMTARVTDGNERVFVTSYAACTIIADQ